MAGRRAARRMRRRAAILVMVAVAAAALAATTSWHASVKADPSSPPAPGGNPVIDTVIGSGLTPHGLLTPIDASRTPQEPYGITASGNVLFVTDPINHVVRLLDPQRRRTNRDVADPFICPCEATVLGDGGYGLGNDDHGVATQLAAPNGVAFNPSESGVIYVVDAYADVIRSYTSAGPGALSTKIVAGQSGAFSFSGDGGAGAGATLNSPYAIALDNKTPSNTLYVADTDNNRIRAINLTDGNFTITTVAGTGSATFDGDGPATAHSLDHPRGLTVDPTTGVLFIADTGNNRIRALDPTTGLLVTVAGTGAAGSNGDGLGPVVELNAPTALAFDTSGGAPTDATVSAPVPLPTQPLVFADTNNDVVRRLSTTGSVTTVAGQAGVTGFAGDGAAATSATLNHPFGVAVTSDGRTWIADTLNRRVRVINSDGVISTIAGTGSQSFFAGNGYSETNEVGTTAAVTMAPRATDLGRVFAVDPEDNLVVGQFPDGTVRVAAGTGAAGFDDAGGDVFSAKLNHPMGIAAAPASAGSTVRIYVADTFNEVIREIDIGSGATSPDYSIQTVAGQAGQAGFSGDGGDATAATLNHPVGLAVDNDGNVYIADSYNNRVRKLDASPGADGTRHITTVAGTGVSGFDPASDGGDPLQAQLYFPYGVATDGSDLLVADTFDQRIMRISGGQIHVVAGSGTAGAPSGGTAATASPLNRPWSAIPDGAGGFFVADHLNNTVDRIDADGALSVYAASGNIGDYGDNEFAIKALLAGPRGLASGVNGGLLVADAFSQRVRRIGTPIVGGSAAGISFGSAWVNCQLGTSGNADSCGVDQTATFTNNGSQAFTAHFQLNAGAPADFRVVSNGCDNHRLQPGDTCSVELAFVPAHANLAIGGDVSVSDPVTGSSAGTPLKGSGYAASATFVEGPGRGTACDNNQLQDPSSGLRMYPTNVRWACDPVIELRDIEGNVIPGSRYVGPPPGLSLKMYAASHTPPNFSGNGANTTWYGGTDETSRLSCAQAAVPFDEAGHATFACDSTYPAAGEQPVGCSWFGLVLSMNFDPMSPIAPLPAPESKPADNSNGHAFGSGASTQCRPTPIN